jgi:hypothetical protein
LWTCSRPTTAALAFVANYRGVNGQYLIGAKNCLFQVQIYPQQGILTPLGPRLGTTLPSAAEETIEYISDAKSLGSAAVIACSAAGINQHLISVCNQLKTLLGFSSRIYVRVEFSCQFAICLLDLILGRIPCYSEDFVMIAQEFASSTLLRYLATALTDAMFPE